jgi:hypothetical protein
VIEAEAELLPLAQSAHRRAKFAGLVAIRKVAPDAIVAGLLALLGLDPDAVEEG